MKTLAEMLNLTPPPSLANLNPPVPSGMLELVHQFTLPELKEMLAEVTRQYDDCQYHDGEAFADVIFFKQVIRVAKGLNPWTVER